MDGFAIKVRNISKVYRLRNDTISLTFFIKQFLGWVLPGKWFVFDRKKIGAYKDFYALHNISFEVRKGQSWGIVGINGSGKSTLLKIISGNLTPSSGSVEVDGKVVILDYGSGFNGDFSGKENIYLKAALLGLTKKQINERFNSIVEFSELGDFIYQPVRTYSSGMISRLGFAIIAHVDADIIITDEALAVGDIFFVQKCMKYIRNFIKRGTFLFVSHSTNDVVSLCDNALWLEHGIVKSIGLAPHVIQDYLNKTYVDHEKNIELKNYHNQTNEKNETRVNLIQIDQPYLSKLMAYSYINRKSQKADERPQSARNEIQIIPGELTGNIDVGKVKILSVNLCDSDGSIFSWVVGGEVVTLAIEILALVELHSPIVGFQLHNSSGQIIFADNSYLLTQKKPVLIQKGTVFVVEFTYQLPYLPIGEYIYRVAVALGQEEDTAVFLLTSECALILKAVSSPVGNALIGIPIYIKNNIQGNRSGSMLDSCKKVEFECRLHEKDSDKM